MAVASRDWADVGHPDCGAGNLHDTLAGQARFRERTNKRECESIIAGGFQLPGNTHGLRNDWRFLYEHSILTDLAMLLSRFTVPEICLRAVE